MRLQLKSSKKEIKKCTIPNKTYYTEQEQEVMFKIVRDYLFQNPGKNAVEVSLHTGVPRNAIMMFLNNGDLHHI